MFVNLSPISTKEIDVGIVDTDIERLIPTTYLLYVLNIVDSFIKYVYFVFISAEVNLSFIIDIRESVFFIIWYWIFFWSFTRGEWAYNAISCHKRELRLMRVNRERH